MFGFGLDLAGYTTGTTCFAAAERGGHDVEAVIFRGSVFSPKAKWKSDAPHSPILKAEVETLQRCLHLGNVAVDVPIDLQELRAPSKATRIWELTNRPIDKAFNALPPLQIVSELPSRAFTQSRKPGGFELCWGTPYLKRIRREHGVY